MWNFYPYHHQEPQQQQQEGDSNQHQHAGSGSGGDMLIKSETTLPAAGGSFGSESFLYQQGGPTTASGHYGLPGPHHHMAGGPMTPMGGPLVSMSNLAAMYQQVHV